MFDSSTDKVLEVLQSLVKTAQEHDQAAADALSFSELRRREHHKTMADMQELPRILMDLLQPVGEQISSFTNGLNFEIRSTMEVQKQFTKDVQDRNIVSIKHYDALLQVIKNAFSDAEARALSLQNQIVNLLLSMVSSYY